MSKLEGPAKLNPCPVQKFWLRKDLKESLRLSVCLSVRHFGEKVSQALNFHLSDLSDLSLSQLHIIHKSYFSRQRELKILRLVTQ